jgi:hypothetical protein
MDSPLDHALGLSDLAGEGLADARTGENGRHALVGMLRRRCSVGLPDTRTSTTPSGCAMIPRCDGIVGGKVAHGCAASPSRMGRFETRWLTTAEPIGACRSFRPMDRQGSSPPSAARRRARHGFERQPDARQTGAERLELWNGHYECICYHPCSCSTSSAIWSAAPSAPAMFTAPMNGRAC